MHEGIEELDFNDLPEHDEEENGYIPDDSKMVFQQHDGSVFCISSSPKDLNLVATGGEDDKGYVWNVETGEIKFECDSHKDSVISCGFNADGKYVMTADMAGTVIVRTVSDGKKVWDFDCSDIEWCVWHTTVHVLFAGTTDGDVYMWKVPSGDCKIYQGHGSKALVGHLLDSGKEILVGYDDGSLKLWDLKNATTVFQSKVEDDAVLCVSGQKGGHLVACGTEAGTVKIFNSPAGKLLCTLTTPDVPRQSDDQELAGMNIESIAFAPSEQYIASGSLNGSLIVWDLATQRIRQHCKHPSGVNGILWPSCDEHVIITACLDGVIRKWNTRTGELIKEFFGHRENILDICLSTDGKLILTAGDDQTARAFER